jgi:hypothetical protein
MSLIPYWEVLTRVGRSKLVSLTIFVPVLGYLIIFNENLVAFLVLSEDIFPHGNPTTGETLSWWFSGRTRLMFLYFGLMFVGVASILYQLLCPTLIKEHGSGSSFIRDEIDLMTGRRTNGILRSLSDRIKESDNGFEELTSLADALRRFYQDDPAAYPEGTRERLNTDLMLLQWENENSRHPHTRSVVAILYLLGFVLLFVPSAELFLRVSSTIYS